MVAGTYFPVIGNEIVPCNPPQGLLTTGQIAALAGVGNEPATTPATLATVGAGTLTAALLVGRVITRSGPTSAFTDTTDTATNIIAALPLPAVIGECFTIEIVNTTSFAQTITGGTGVTLAGLAGPNPANSTLRAWLQYTSATAVTITVVEMPYNAVGGYEPSTVQTQFGSGTQTFLEEGNINRQISAAGVSPGATAADNVMAVYTLPANSFDVAGRGIYIQAQGTFAANAHNKDIKIIFNPATAVVGSTVGTGGSTVCDTGVVATSGGGWQVSAFVYKYGAAGSNTQMGLNSGSIAGVAHLGTAAPVLITAIENAAILVAITGNATTTATDIVFNFLEVNALN